jgi:hypothetical protein
MNANTPTNSAVDKPPPAPQEPDDTKPDPMEQQLKYVLYSHISYGEDEDLPRYKGWKKRKEQSAGDGHSGTLAFAEFETSCPLFRIVEDLRPFLKELTALLSEKGTPGVLVLFYAMGYAACLEEIAAEQRRSQKELIENHPELQCAELVQERLQEMFDRTDGLAKHVRIVSALDLYDALRRIESGYAQILIQWFIGLQEEKIRYDAPKIVEAILRIRMIGSGVPVFRIDQDVLFCKPVPGDDGNAKLPAIDLGEPSSRSISKCVEAFRLRRDDPHMSAFIFSGSYDSGPLGQPGECYDFKAWSRAFATRCFPGLLILPNRLEEARTVANVADQARKNAIRSLEDAQPDASKKLEQAGKDAESAYNMWGKYCDAALNPKLMCQFFGIKETLSNQHLEADPEKWDGIAWLGAHPLVSVISGALLCINDSAILDLPPFSNFNRNVMWIDDHLKYCLHRELRHFTTISIDEDCSPLLRDARVDEVQVKKGRPQILNLPEYVLGEYLPTLLFGSVMDAWITPDIDVASFFLLGEIKDLPLFASRLTQSVDGVSIFLMEHFSTQTKMLLRDFDRSSSDRMPLEKALVDDLNRITIGNSIFDAERFRNVKFRPETEQYIEQDAGRQRQKKPSGFALLGLNRLLLEDAYPSELSKRTDHRIMKWRPEPLDGRWKDEWHAVVKKGPSKGLLPSRLQIVLARGRPMSPLESLHFKRQLLETALERISMVRMAWSSLEGEHAGQHGRVHTFASAWAIGEPIVEGLVPGMTDRAKGLVREVPQAQELLKRRDLNEEIQEDLMMLIEDAITYIDMTLNWSKTVQLIRSIEPGTLKTDLFWNPKDK